MGNNTGAGKESWEGLGEEDEEGVDKGKDTWVDLVNAHCLNIIIC